MIAISLSPNTECDDYIVALKALSKPWSWKTGTVINKVEEWFREYLKNPYIFSLNSGRSAMYLLLKAFGVGKGDEVIIQAFTCLAVPEVILWCEASPKYCDIDETHNLDPILLEKAITPKTKAIIVQHTLGIPADMEMITKIAQKYKIILLEDCAHSLGATQKGQRIGTFGDAAFFSFGRDKIVSSVFGGVAAINPKHPQVIKNFKKIYFDLKFPTYFWIFQQLLHPLMFFIILPSYNLIVGKILLVLLQKLKLLSFPIYQEEKEGQRPNIFPKRYPNALASLIMNQLEKLEELNNHRKNIARIYYDKLLNKKDVSIPRWNKESVYLRFNILINNPDLVRQRAYKNGILLGNWYHDIIDPPNTRKVALYQDGLCPNAEKISQTSLNLPTNISLTEKDIDKIIAIL